jgi:hypothetical protein
MLSDLSKRGMVYLAAPQGFEPRYADPELMDHIKEKLGFHAENSITCLQLKPARKHFDVVLKRLALARSESKRMAHLRHTDFHGFCPLKLVGTLIPDQHIGVRPNQTSA